MSPFLIVTLLVSCSVGALLLVIHNWWTERQSTLNRRIDQLSLTRTNARGPAARKRTVEETLREINERSVSQRRARPSLVLRMRQADLTWSKNTYYLSSMLCGIVIFGGIRVTTTIGLLQSLGFGVASALLIPHLYVSLKRNRRFKHFSMEFPNAIDVIVRGVRSGLPLVDCLKIIAAEAQEPVKTEFKAVVEDQTMGMPLEEAVNRLPERVPLPEANFFSIVIAMQSQTGGSLAEALANLSGVLRERKKMKAKVKAVSSEAKASALIIAALPLMVAGMIFLTSPAYISLLFTTGTGKTVLFVCMIWMMFGTLVMRKMINFDI